MRVAMVAGEPSGDLLGGELIEALRRRWPALQVEGIGGARMTAAGCRSLYPMERLSVMGLLEVLGRYPELYRARRRLVRVLLERRPDVFIGIDAPDFNLGLAQALHRNGIRTVQYVSPTVWAWRPGRVHGIARAVDCVLLLFPFEQAIYKEHGIRSVFVGHPLADRIPMTPDPAAARMRLGLPGDGRVVALMPGSRGAELDRMTAPFLGACEWLRRRHADVTFTCSLLDDDAAARFRACTSRAGMEALPLRLFTDRAHDVLEAADCALVTSGTVTLQAMLCKTPMVVAYRMNPLSYRILRTLVRVKYVALPNLLADAPLVPEFLQRQCGPERLGAALERWLENPDSAAALRGKFRELHAGLRRGASECAARAVAGMVTGS